MTEPAESEGSEPLGTGRALRRVGRVLVLIYVALLLLSHGVRLLQGRGPEAPTNLDSLPGLHTVETPEIAPTADGEAVERLERRIRLTWWEWEPAHTESAPVVLLIHGSPGSGDNFSALGPLLADAGLRVLAPDLPGFGRSSMDLADYSIWSHAAYMMDLLTHLEIDEVHVVGFSLGGGVAAHLVEDLGPRLRSLTLLSATGVQELELLGSYAVNHGIHGAQLVAFQLIRELLPHFGALDRRPVYLTYARNFFDSDQRPVREIFESYDGPALVLHADDDFLVPVEAALEHHRILPQSRLVRFEDGNHFVVFRSPERLAEPLVDLVRSAEDGTATRRQTASAERLAAAAEGAPVRLPRAVGPTLMVWIFLLAVATLVSEDLTCLAAGLLVAQGSLGFGPAVFACALGIFVGDMGLYFLGRLGSPFMHRAPLRWIVSAEDLERSRAWFDTKGAWAILISRFLPGLRVPTYVTAGLLAMNTLWFGLALLLPILAWTPLLVGAAYLLGDKVYGAFERFEGGALGAFFGLLIGLWFLLWLFKSLSSWKKRRLLVGKWKRTAEWEFWPRWAFYPPVVLYVLWLAVRYRSATLFTAANPGFPNAGGLVGESKSAILDRIDPQHVAPWVRLPGAEAGPEARRETIRSFMARDSGAKDAPFPVVLKPDVGERGSGVAIVKNEAQLEAFLEAQVGPAIVQRYVPGVELGIFWIHLPGEARGRIFSITHKQLPEVEGDGESTLETLILRDRRAVAMAPTYLDRFKNELEDVPAAGERRRLVDVGTHCLGAVFVDGDVYRTPELEAAVEEIGQGIDGFYFGRFDMRAPSFDHFRRGEQISVLELNGVTSEATHIYDPKHRVFRAWGILFEQWRAAFEIGRRNRAAGHEPASFGEIRRLFREYRRRPG